MSNRTRTPRVTPITVAVRRVALLAPRPEFVRTGAAPVWMERLEARRVLSAFIGDGREAAVMSCALGTDLDGSVAEDGELDATDISEELAEAELDIAIDDLDVPEIDDSEWWWAEDDEIAIGDGDADGEVIDEGEIVDVAGPTSDVATSEGVLDIVDADGNVLQSYRSLEKIFGETWSNAGSYWEVALADVQWSVPIDLAEGESVTYTWDVETGDIQIVDRVPEIAESGMFYTTVTRIPTDSAEVTGPRGEYNQPWTDEDGWLNWDEVGCGITAGMDPADLGLIPVDARADDDVVYALGGDPAVLTANLADGAGIAEQPAEPTGSVDQQPLPIGDLPAVEARDLNDVLSSGTKKHDILDGASASLIELVR